MTNIRYLTGFTGSNAYLLVTERSAAFFTDSRYTTQAASEVRGVKVSLLKKSWVVEVSKKVLRLGINTLAFEEVNLSVATHRALKKALVGVKLKPSTGLVERVRLVKEPSEIAAIRHSVELLDKGFVEAKRRIRAGQTETEIAARIEYYFKQQGAEALSFEIIIASGERSALPHGVPSKKLVQRGDMVIVDMGVVVDGYCSDETCTFAVGRCGRAEQDIYRIVKDAHDLAIEEVRPGIKASEVDKTARDFIKRAGYAGEFGHGLGHGVGLDVHEGPTVGPRSEDILTEGMVFTVEPGLYLPGKFGVRIEDMVLVTTDGCEVLTRSSKEMMIIG